MDTIYAADTVAALERIAAALEAANHLARINTVVALALADRRGPEDAAEGLPTRDFDTYHQWLVEELLGRGPRDGER